MKIDAAALAIVNTWDAGWTAAQPTVPYTLDDDQYQPPSPPAPWARFAIRHEVTSLRTQGRPARFRRTGKIWVSLFSPVNAGRKPLDLLIASSIAILESITIGALSDCVTTYEASPRESPTDGVWAMATVTVPFDYWEQK